jgi:hypothetical protein
MNGGDNTAFDFGVRLGGPGIGGDDVRVASFTLDATEDLTIDMLRGQRFGTRLTSVGTEDGARDGSLKIVDKTCIPLCEDVVVDFEQFATGQKVSKISLLDGVLKIGVFGREFGEANVDNDAIIYDADDPATPPSGGDDDLLAGDGKILVIAENNSGIPDDSKDGGEFKFTFSTAVDLTSVNVIDTEEGGLIRAFDAAGLQIGSVAIPTTADGGLATVDLSAFDDVKQLRIAFNGSGGLDDLALEYCQPGCDCLIL